jgi:DNA-directed RNA polymerase
MDKNMQVLFQRQKNNEKKERLAIKLDKNKKTGKFEFIDNDMILAYSKLLKEGWVSASHNSHIRQFIKTLEAQNDDRSIYIDPKSDIFDVVSVTVYKFIVARLFGHLSRWILIDDLCKVYGWERGAATQLVGDFLELFSDRITRTSVYSPNGHSHDIIHPTDDFLEQIEQHEAALIESQRALWPLALPPKPWTQSRDTVFHDPLIPCKIVKDNVRPQNYNLDMMFETANNLSKTEYKINNLVLERALAYQKKGDFSPFKSKKYSKWDSRKKVRGGQKSAERKIRGVLSAATHFKDDSFWHAWSYDYRGRIYSISRVLDPQGSELEKSLHVSGTPIPVTEAGIRELKISLMNSIGDDKISLAERVRKADKLLEDGILGQWVLGTDDGWVESDSPFHSLSYANELVRWKASGYDNNMLSSVFLAIDASCSGFQLLAGIQKDQNLANLVNINTDDTAIGDLYSAVGNAVASSYTGPLKDLILNRSLWKKPVMCTLYSLTQQGLKNYILEELERMPAVVEWFNSDAGKEFDIKDFKLLLLGRFSTLDDEKIRYVKFMRKMTDLWDDKTSEKVIRKAFKKAVKANTVSLEDWKVHRRRNIHWKEVVKLAKIFTDIALPSVAPQSASVLDCLKGWMPVICASEAFAKQGNTLKWTTPSGFVVNQKQMYIKNKTIRSQLLLRRTDTHTIYTDTDKVNGNKHKACITANIFHSLDASIVSLVTNQLAGLEIAQIHNHDAFSARAGDAAQLHQTVRQAYLEVVSSDPLEAIRKELESRFDVELAPLPAKGDWDASIVLNSPYAFR